MRNPDKPVRLYSVMNGLLRLRNVDVYVTGSNSKMLSRDVMTEFRGRGDTVDVHPLSFAEYYDWRGGDKNDAYEEYAFFGGMPFVWSKATDEDKSDYLKSLFQEVYYKDIMERYELEHPDVLDELTDVLCSSIGSLTNASKLADTLNSVKQLKVNHTTIGTYLKCLTDSFLSGFPYARTCRKTGRDNHKGELSEVINPKSIWVFYRGVESPVHPVHSVTSKGLKR